MPLARTHRSPHRLVVLALSMCAACAAAGPTPSEPAAPPASAASPTAAPARDAEVLRVLKAATRFYGAQRSGDGANWLLEPGKTCFMRDGEELGVDLSGGWFDAGDQLKSTLSTAHAAHQVLKAYDAFGAVFPDDYGPRYGPANGIPDVLDEMAYGLDWLVAAHYRPDALVHTIGGFAFDHGTWAPCDVKQDLPVADGGEVRPIDLHPNMEDTVVARADFAGMAAAALALGSVAFEPYSPERARTYREAAVSLFAYGQAHPGSSAGFYADAPGMRPDDDMMCGAIELYRATGEAGYLEEAKRLAAIVRDTTPEYTFAHSAEGCWHSFFEAGELAAVRGYWDAAVARDAARLSDQPYVQGLIFSGEQWGTLDRALSAAFVAALHDDATGDPESRDLALSQLDYVMGRNPYERSFIVGLGSNPPGHPHHANAHGHASWQAYHEQEPHRHSLAGALVGGPTATAYDDVSMAGYEDVIDDYVGNEVGILYNDGLVGVAAFALAVGYDGGFW